MKSITPPLFANLKFAHLFFLLSLGFSASVNASEPMLMRFFEEVETLQSSFEQRIVDESGNTLEVKKGIFSLSRPGRFRWNYVTDDPDYPEGQQIISDGSTITFYEPDLETANQRSMINALEQVPTLLLVQSGESLEKHFNVTDFGKTDGLTWVALKPKDENAGYQGLMIGFDKELLSAIVLTDGLGNETRLTLRDVVANQSLDDQLFTFVPTEGVDLIQ